MMRRRKFPENPVLARRSLVSLAFALIAAAILWTGGQAHAHAIVVESTPAMNAEVPGPDVTVTLHYNNRIDKARSRLTLLAGDKPVKLVIDTDGAPDILTTRATGLAPGTYRLRWQVLALDGHITRGEIPFTVTAP